nr:DUF2852 domain-containing protein [Oryzibacter oryziterrae]
MMHGCTLRPGFHPLSIGLMVLGFVLFWPIGLAVLAYMLWGDRMRSKWNTLKPQFEQAARQGGFQGGFSGGFSRTGNTAFDEYREAEFKRLEEERAALDRMRDEFDEFLRNLRRAKDQEEFDRFKSTRHTG